MGVPILAINPRGVQTSGAGTGLIGALQHPEGGVPDRVRCQKERAKDMGYGL